MIDVHTIRLRDPWKFVAPACYTRNFHAPAGLEDLEQVWLVIGSSDSPGTVILNSEKIGELAEEGEAFRDEITHRLVEFNQLVVNVVGEHDGPPFDQVRLEIGFPS